MSSDDDLSQIVYTEAPVEEIWSRLSFFESEHNAKEFLNKFSLNNTDLIDVSRALSYTMSTAREYYKSADSVSLLTKPLLIFYGMTALSKVLFISTYGKKSPSKGHGLKSPQYGSFPELLTPVLKDGTFPQFHSCYSKDKLFRMKFSIKELLSLVPEVKVEYETVYNEKSKTLKTLKTQHGFRVIDSEIEKYGDLTSLLVNLFSGIIAHAYTPQRNWISIMFPVGVSRSLVPLTRAISGEEYIVLPLKKHGKDTFLPEMSVHFVIMYILGMISRYQPKEWGEIIDGEESGDVYIIQKLLKATIRKFPNMILDRLRNRNFVFVSPQYESTKQLTNEQKEELYKYIQDRRNREFRSQIHRFR